MLLDAGAKVRNLGDVRWVATEDATAHKGTGRHIAMFVLDPIRDVMQGPMDMCHSCGTTYAVRALYCHNCGARR